MHNIEKHVLLQETLRTDICSRESHHPQTDHNTVSGSSKWDAHVNLYNNTVIDYFGGQYEMYRPSK